MSTSMPTSESKSLSPVVIGIAGIVLLVFIGYLVYQFSRSEQAVVDKVTLPPEVIAHLGVPPPAPTQTARQTNPTTTAKTSGN